MGTHHQFTLEKLNIFYGLEATTRECLYEMVFGNQPTNQPTTDLKSDLTTDLTTNQNLRTTNQNLTTIVEKRILKRVWDLPTFDSYKLKEQEFEKYTLSPHDVVEGVLVCHKCKSKKICAYSRQVRSGDEPMSVFAKCSMCQHYWVQ